VSYSRFGEDDSLLKAPTETVRFLEAESHEAEFSPGIVAQLPKFLRSFYLRFLAEIVGFQIERFSVEERDQISDLLVDLETSDEKRPTWPLLSDFVDLCDYFDDFGLLSVPEAAQEHEAEIFELSARVLHDLSSWAKEEEFERLSTSSRELAAKLESLGSGARTR
jgi:hypothetical protein